MENAQLISLSRQMALQRQMDVVANNLANMTTTGFKAEQLLFEEYKMPVARDQDFARPDQTLSYVMDWATVHDLTSGPMLDTGNPLDVALQGKGFLVVQTSDGEKYTKAGSLAIGQDGVLKDPSGNPILGSGGPITFDASETDISISADGTVSSSAGTKGTLRVVEFSEPQNAQRYGENLWTGGSPVPATDTKVMQGAIERSNVSSVAQMSEMIRIQRAYEGMSSLIQKQDDQRRDAIKKLGSLNA
ncbi:MAG: flagellar basal-body rod protein FlgF [Rubrivivax sp.]